MGPKNTGRFLARSAAWTIVYTASVLLLPFLLKGGASFLGKDVSSVAAGVMQFYPWIAIAEALRVFGVAAAASFVVVALTRAAAMRFSSRLARLLCFPLLPLGAYVVWLSAAVLKYPALYESFLPASAQHAVYAAAAVTSPGVLTAFALALLAAGPAAALAAGLATARSRVTAFALLLALAALLPSLPGWSEGLWRSRSLAAPAGDKPPVILIGIDSLRGDRLQRPEVTPAIRALLEEKETVSFQDHQIGVPRTFPSWIEMLTGRQAPKNGVRHMFPGFGARQEPFDGMATALRDVGYDTRVISDFAGDIFPRFEAGFETVDAPNLTLSTMIKLSVDQAAPGLLPLMTTGPGLVLFSSLKESPVFGDPAQLVDKALASLQVGREKPLFLTLFFSTAHFPYAAPHPYYRYFSPAGYAGPYLFQRNPELKVQNGEMPEADVAQVRALYDGAVRAVDDQLARLFKALKSSGLYDKSVIVVTADHGEDLFEKGRLQGHGEHLRGEHVLRVPLVVKLPKGHRVVRPRPDFLTRSIDLAATVVAAAGLTRPVGDGQNLLPFVTSDAPPPVLDAYAETGIWFSRSGQGFFQQKRLDYPGISGLLNFDQGYSGEITLNQNFERMIAAAKHRMLVKGDYKVIYMPTDHGVEWELYDRKQDPDSEHDLSKERPELLAALQKDLHAKVQELEPKASRLGDFVVPSL